MPYIDEAYFASYTGGPVPDNFALLESRAAAIIDELTRDQINWAGGLSLLPAFTQDRVKKSVAEQVQTIIQNGGETVLAGQELASVGIGKFNYSVSPASSGTVMIGGVPVSQMVIIYLAPTGLMFRGET